MAKKLSNFWCVTLRYVLYHYVITLYNMDLAAGVVLVRRVQTPPPKPRSETPMRSTQIQG